MKGINDLKGKKHVSNTFRTAIIIVMATILLVCVSEPVHVAGQDSTLKKNSNWSKQTTNPIILDPSVEISIINKCSSPEKGENWTVNFITKGRADLKIIPNDEKTIIDDEFVGLYCGEQKVEPQILEGDIIYYPNWECEETARVVHYTLTRSHHTLRFEFGREKDYAYNDCNSACYHNPSTKDCSLANPTCSCSYGYKKIIHCLEEACGSCNGGGCGDYFTGCPHTCSRTRDDYIQITRVCCPNCDASDTYVCSGGDVYFRDYYCDTQTVTSSASDAVFCNYEDTLYDSCDGYEERNDGCQYREETCSGGSCVWGDWTNQNEGEWCGSPWEVCYDSGSCDVRTYRHKCSSGVCTGTYLYSTGCSTCTACNGQDCGTCCECSGETRTYDPSQDGDCSATDCYTGDCGGLDSCAVYSNGEQGTCNSCYECNDADPACDEITSRSSDWNVDCSDNCVISSNVDMNGYSLLFSGSGTFNVNADITDFNIVSISSGCKVSIANGYKFG